MAIAQDGHSTTQQASLAGYSPQLLIKYPKNGMNRCSQIDRDPKVAVQRIGVHLDLGPRVDVAEVIDVA